MMKALECYIRNDVLTKNILKFSQATIVQYLSFTNKKFTTEFLSRGKANEKTLFEEFYDHMSFEESFDVSLLPVCMIENLANAMNVIRNYHTDPILNEPYTQRNISAFAITFIINQNVVKNPHLRSELFNILFNFLVLHPDEHKRTPNIGQLSRILQDNFIKSHLIHSMMLTYIDAERTGTAQQYYEKFSLRTKILMVLNDTILKKDISYLFKLGDFAKNQSETCVRLINLVISDLTYLSDEILEKLEEIKKYQDLLADVEKFKSLDQEAKNLELEKFNQNDRIAKAEGKVNP